MADTTVNITKKYIPQIDYLSRDYTSILTDLTAIAKQFNPNWSVSDPADIGVALLETFAYLGDILSFYTDRMASEAFIGTASQKASVLQLASMLGYIPTSSSPSKVNINVTNNDAVSSITIPKLSKIASTLVVNGESKQVVFELDSALTIAASTTVSASATQGVTSTNESIGVSDGTPSQFFKIPKIGVIVDNSGTNITVTVGGIQYTYTSSLVDNSPYDAVFTTSMDADGYTYIGFGDGINGKIPPAAYPITATYRVGVGADGNIPMGSLASTFLEGTWNATVTQLSAATGGSNDESVDSIRLNAPKALRTLRRAVSLKDYAYLALQVNGVSKANSTSNVWSNINLYVAPFSSAAVNTYGPITGVTAIDSTAKDGTVGSGYIKYTGANGLFSNLVAGESYVTIFNSNPVEYNLYTPTLVQYVSATSNYFTVAAPAGFTVFPAASPSTMQITATGATTTAFNSVVSNVLNYFTDKVAPNVTLNVLPPTYIPVNMNIEVRILPQYNQAAVATLVDSALSNLVSYNNSFFADRLTPHLVLNSLTNIDGVDYATISHLRKSSNEQMYSVTGWNRPTTTTMQIFTPNVNSITPGQNVRLYGIGQGMDGDYPVASVGSKTVTVSVPYFSGVFTTANPSSTYSSPGTIYTFGVSSATGLKVGMTVTSDVSGAFTSGTVITAISGNNITVSKVVAAVISPTTTLTFTWTPVVTDNYIKVMAIDEAMENGVATLGVICAANEMPVKGIFNISAIGGIV